MSGPDYPQDDQGGTVSKVPSLIHDYRAQREAWREQARNLARMREEVLTAADSEARDIVSSARADIRRILLKARRDLLVLAAQVRAAGRLGEAEDAPDTVTYLPADELGQAQDVVNVARQGVRHVLDESRPELEGLAAEGEALRAALRQQRPPAPVHRRLPTPIEQPLGDSTEQQTPVDFEFTSIAADEDSDLTLHRPARALRTFIVAAAMLGGIVMMGTVWWLNRPSAPAKLPSAQQAKSTAPAEPARSLPSARPASTGAAPTRAAAVGGNAAPKAGVLAINVAATGTAWIRLTTDGRVAVERTFKAGETHAVSASREIIVRSGNAGAVLVSVDGRQATVFGRDGQLVERRFAVAQPRVQPPTPAAPPARPAPSPSVPIAQSAPRSAPAPATPPSASSAAPPIAVQRTPEPKPVVTPPAAAPSVAVVAAPPAAPPPATAPPAAALGRGATIPTDRPAASLAAAPLAQKSLQDSLVGETVRWLDAYYRQDRASMSAIAAKVNVSDDRNDKERLPRGLSAVRRSLEDVQFRVYGSEAMLTARMTERMENTAAGQMAQAVSFVSQMWTQRNGSWQLYDVRIVSAAALGRAAGVR